MKKTSGLIMTLIMLLTTVFTLAACVGGKTVPAAPQNLTVAEGDGQITLTWSAPSDTGGSAITKYEVQRDKSGGGEWIFVGTATSYTFIGLTNGVTYTFLVRAANSKGFGAEASETATPYDMKPSTDYVLPTNLKSVCECNNTNGNNYQVTAIKIGNDYYAEVRYEVEEADFEIFLKYDGNGGWNRYLKWTNSSNPKWEKNPQNIFFETTLKEYLITLFPMTVSEYLNAFQVISRDSSGDTIIAGKSTQKYTYSRSENGLGEGSVDYWYEPDSKLFFKIRQDYTGGTYTVTMKTWDESVVGFGSVTLPQ